MSQSPKWVNPCRLPTHPIDPDKDFAGAPPVPVKELLRNVMNRAKFARNHGQQVKETFVSNLTFTLLSPHNFTFNDAIALCLFFTCGSAFP